MENNKQNFLINIYSVVVFKLCLMKEPIGKIFQIKWIEKWNHTMFTEIPNLCKVISPQRKKNVGFNILMVLIYKKNIIMLNEMKYSYSNILQTFTQIKYLHMNDGKYSKVRAIDIFIFSCFVVVFLVGFYYEDIFQYFPFYCLHLYRSYEEK